MNLCRASPVEVCFEFILKYFEVAVTGQTILQRRHLSHEYETTDYTHENDYTKSTIVSL